MAIFVNSHTKVMVQGITGNAGAFHAEQMLAYTPTKLVAGVSPDRGGESFSAGANFRFGKSRQRKNRGPCFSYFLFSAFCARCHFGRPSDAGA